MMAVIFGCIILSLLILRCYSKSLFNDVVQMLKPDFWHRKIKYVIQRCDRGFSDSDVYCLDYHLADIISQALKKFKTNPYMSVPVRIYEDKGSEKRAFREWLKILDKMIYTFETAKKIVEGEVIYVPTDTPNFRKVRESYRKIAKELPAKLLTCREAKRYEEGFDLFKKYFLDLWI